MTARKDKAGLQKREVGAASRQSSDMKKPSLTKLSKRKELRLSQRQRDSSEEDRNRADVSGYGGAESSCGLSSTSSSPSPSPAASKTASMHSILKSGDLELAAAAETVKVLTGGSKQHAQPRHYTATGRELYAFDEIPPHLQDNKFIRNYYRAYMSTSDCFVSVFEIHNETGNIWTHLLGFFVYCYLLYWVHTGVLRDDSDWFHRLMLTILVGSLMTCLAASTLFHVLLGHEDLWVFKISHALDYGGATCLLMGTFLPICYYVFVCQPHLQIAYVLMACVLGITGIVAPLVPWFEDEGMFFARLGIYGAIGSSAAFPTIHMFLSTPINHVTLPVYVGIVFIFLNSLLATVIYASHFPERFAPGRFDLWLSSHQIWHSLIFLGGVVQIFNGIAVYQNWSIMQGKC